MLGSLFGAGATLARWGVIFLILLTSVIGFLFLTRGTMVRRVRGVGKDGAPVSPDEADFPNTVAMLTGAELLPGTRVELALNGDGIFGPLWADLRAAERLITIQMYYMGKGRLADQLAEILVERARAGVQVVFLFDAFGASAMGPGYWRRLRAGGVQAVALGAAHERRQVPRHLARGRPAAGARPHLAPRGRGGRRRGRGRALRRDRGRSRGRRRGRAVRRPPRDVQAARPVVRRARAGASGAPAAHRLVAARRGRERVLHTGRGGRRGSALLLLTAPTVPCGRARVDAAAARGLDAVYLLTTTADAYFPRFGFARVAREAVAAAVRGTLEFASACPASAVAMVKPLTAPHRRGTAVTPPPRRPPFRVLVLSTGNSARSQIGEALLATRGAVRPRGRVEAASAGSRPAPRVNPYAVEVLRDRGIAWEGRTPKSRDDVAGEQFDLVVTVCDNARDACPYFPGAGAQVHWGLPDPADVAGPAAARRAFAATYDALAARVDALLELPLERLGADELHARAQAVHAQAPRPAGAPEA